MITPTSMHVSRRVLQPIGEMREMEIALDCLARARVSASDFRVLELIEKFERDLQVIDHQPCRFVAWPEEELASK